MGVQALCGIDLDVREREIHALLGHNGAGKSTLVKILTGIYPVGSYEGTVTLDGSTLELTSPADARARGIGYVPQEIQAIPHLTVAENILVGQMGRRRGALRFRDAFDRAGRILARLDLAIDPRAYVSSLSAAQRHLVMVARALAASPSILLLDEPTASLSRDDTARLFAALRRLHEEGMTMIYITHRLLEIGELCNRATILRDGAVVGQFGQDEFDHDRIVGAMVGRRLESAFPTRSGRPADEDVLSVRHLRIPRPNGGAHILSDVSFDLRRGEILGIAGLLGSGRTELLGALYGRFPSSGEITVAGSTVELRRPADARRAGIALLTEDRKHEGLLFNLPLGQNITIGNLAQFSRGPLVDRSRERAAAAEYVQKLAVKTRSVDADVNHLSGGNQQKLLFSRVLMRKPAILLLDEPTKGVDVETRQELYRLMLALADGGLSIVLVSSEIPEVLGIADRCVVLADGVIVDQFPRGEGSEERVISAITRGAAGLMVGAA